MEIRIRDDCVEIEGYVNAIERDSRPLWSRMGQFIERICKGAFKRALDRADDVRILLNHDCERDLGGIRDGNLELCEDAIGLHARATIRDAQVIEDARNGDLVGWSFGFTDTDNGVERSIDQDSGLPLRKVRDLNLHEVSLLNRAKTPAYEGTLVTVRSDEQMKFRSEPFFDEVKTEEIKSEIREDNNQPQPETDEHTKEIDYSKYEQMIEEMKGELKK